MRGQLAFLFVQMALLAGGCSLQSDSQIRLVPVSYEQWQEELKELKGSIVVVDMWATWCVPCLERFPHMVEMHEKYRDQDVTFISMSLDDRTDEQAVSAAREFLIEQNATFTNYLMDENIVEGFEKLDLLGIPAVFIYDRDGELRYRLTGDDPNNQFTSEDVEEAIQTLLKDQA